MLLVFYMYTIMMISKQKHKHHKFFYKHLQSDNL